MRQHVEGDLVRVELLLDRLAGSPLAGLGGERLDAGLPAAGDGLVGADDDALDAGGVVDGLERDDHLDGGAVGRRDDAGVRREVVGVDLGHHERHAGVLAEHARLVDDGGAGGDGLRHELLAHGAAGGEEDEVDAVERAGAELLHLDVGAVERQLAAGGARAGEEPELPDGEAALLEDRAHGAADDAGRAGDGDGVLGGHQQLPLSAGSWLTDCRRRARTRCAAHVRLRRRAAWRSRTRS